MAYDGVTLKRANLVVRDMERSLRIYRDILGLTIDYIKDSESTSYSYPVFRFPAHAKLRFATLSAGAEQVRCLALTEVTGVTLPEMPSMSLSAVVMQAGNLDRILAQLRTEPGVRIIPEQELVTNSGAKGREVAFIDPDGHLVVLFRMNA